MKLNVVSRKINARYPCLALIFFAVLIQAGCTTYEMNSLWKTDEINIDGKSSDWLGKLIYIEAAHISVGLQNDEEVLYICIVAENPSLRAQVMGQGLTLWFDPEGGKNKSFGIKFPLPKQLTEEQRKMMTARDPELDKEDRMEEFKPAHRELEILYPEEDKNIKLPIKKAEGIEVMLKPSSGVLVYELSVPLRVSEPHPYAIGVKAEKTIGIGLEVPKRDRSAMRNAGRGGMGRGPGGGMVPAGGGRSGGMRGGGGIGRGPGMINGLKIWVGIQLASEMITPPPIQTLS